MPRVCLKTLCNYTAQPLEKHDCANRLDSRLLW